MSNANGLKQLYYKIFPFAQAVGGELWVVVLQHIKLSDNQLGFGKKIYWNRAELESIS